jgi:AMMECR1 domain-containing protein
MYSGVLLPQVPVEQRWNREQFLSGTCRKAGLPPSAWRDGDVDFYTFSAVIFSEKQ